MVSANHVKVGDYESHFVDKIYLDGEVMNAVTEFNISEGWLIRIKEPVAYDKKAEKFYDEKLTGTITVTWKEK